MGENRHLGSSGVLFSPEVLNSRAWRELLSNIYTGNLALPGLLNSQRHSSFYLQSFKGKDAGNLTSKGPATLTPKVHVLWDAIGRFVGGDAQAWCWDAYKRSEDQPGHSVCTAKDQSLDLISVPIWSSVLHQFMHTAWMGLIGPFLHQGNGSSGFNSNPGASMWRCYFFYPRVEPRPFCSRVFIFSHQITPASCSNWVVLLLLTLREPWTNNKTSWTEL